MEPIRNPTESDLAALVDAHGILRGLRVPRTGDFFVWPAQAAGHVPMADALEDQGRIAPGEPLERLVIDNPADAWWLYRDAP